MTRSKLVAWCFPDGVVHFSQGLPNGALPIAHCLPDMDPAEFKDTVEGLCRLAYDNVTRLVPGIPEAEGDDELAQQDLKLDALWEFSVKVRQVLQDPVVPPGKHPWPPSPEELES